MTDERRPAPLPVVLAVVAIFAAVAWYMMVHIYRPRSTNECHQWYQEAKTLADTLEVERRSPGHDTGEIGPWTCKSIRMNARWFELPPNAYDLLDLAITAAGGAFALDSLAAVEWEGSATVHLPDTSLQILGRWAMIPPDTARVSTWVAGQDSTSARTMIVAAPRGWIVRGGSALPMPPEMLVEERHQFYLYSLLQLLPLRDPAFTLELLPTDAHYRRGFLVKHPGRLDVEMYLAPNDRIERLMTRFAVPGDSAGAVQEIRLEGETWIGNARWFQQMHITRDGAPYFDLAILQGRTARHPEMIGIPR